MPAPAPTDSDSFFLPNLCTVQAVLFLVLIAELLALVLVLNRGGLDPFQWRDLAYYSLYLQWTVLLSAACLCQLRPRLKGWPVARAAVVSYGVILLITAITALVAQWLLNGALLGNARWTVDPWPVVEKLLICAVLAGIALRYFYLAAQLQQRREAELAARIDALQARIRPHFLFNSMNSIASLIGVDDSAAEKAVEDLSTLFRASLAEAGTEVTLAEEFALCRRYLAVEGLRLGPRLQVQWRVDTLPPTLPIPGLTLQPLLENALYHGVGQLAEGGTVVIEGDYRDGLLTLAVDNPVPADAAPHPRGNRLALENIRHRLQALYGDEAVLEAERHGDRYRAELRYPARERPIGEAS